MAEFEFEIDKWVAKAHSRIERAPLAIAYALLGRLQELTPVDTGRLRAGWQIEEEPYKIVISNRVEYAARINFGFTGKDSLGREYNQRGAHMVEQVIAEGPAIAEKVIRDLQP